MPDRSSLLIVTPVSPRSLEDGNLRSLIFKLFLRQFDYINALNYRVILLSGEIIHTDNKNIQTIVVTTKTKRDRLNEVKQTIIRDYKQFTHICRLDDDDFLNPNLNEYWPQEHFDAWYDNQHCFYDIASDRFASQKRLWMPNTTIMTMDCAFGEWHEKGKSLLFDYDHSATWHLFFDDKRTIASRAENPIYLRVLSPFSITSEQNRAFVDERIIMRNYFDYLSGFGSWVGYNMIDFKSITFELRTIWLEYHGNVINFGIWIRLQFFFRSIFLRIWNKLN